MLDFHQHFILLSKAVNKVCIFFDRFCRMTIRARKALLKFTRLDHFKDIIVSIYLLYLMFDLNYHYEYGHYHLISNLSIFLITIVNSITDKFIHLYYINFLVYFSPFFIILFTISSTTNEFFQFHITSTSLITSLSLLYLNLFYHSTLGNNY